MKIPDGKLSRDVLHHFQCGNCKRWWSIGDAHKVDIVDHRQWYCPWCGYQQIVKEEEPIVREY